MNTHFDFTAFSSGGKFVQIHAVFGISESISSCMRAIHSTELPDDITCFTQIGSLQTHSIAQKFCASIVLSGTRLERRISPPVFTLTFVSSRSATSRLIIISCSPGRIFGRFCFQNYNPCIAIILFFFLSSLWHFSFGVYTRAWHPKTLKFGLGQRPDYISSVLLFSPRFWILLIK